MNLNFVLILFMGMVLLPNPSLMGRPPEPPHAPLLIVDRTTSSSQPRPAKNTSIKTIRVGLKIEVDRSEIFAEGPLEIVDLKSGKKRSLSQGEFTITAKPSQVWINGDKWGGEVRFVPQNENDPLRSQKIKVRGTLKVIANGEGKLTVINEVGLDHYLMGVLPREVISSWPEEALRAQAVASRSYLMANLGKYNSKGFDICADVMCQVYGGLSAEKPQTSKAVEDTPGEVLVYDGKPIPAYFHASCGGHTEEIYPVWGSPNKAYLQAKKDPFGGEAPWFHWKLDMSHNQILSLLKNKDLVQGDQLKKISIKQKSKSGRAHKLVVTTDKGNFEMLGNSFRMALDPEKIRSTLWTQLQRRKNGYHFEGKGWGHGLGLSQWGAKGRAEAGMDYREILRFYYPNTKHTTLDKI